jgi:hypothetical protein
MERAVWVILLVLLCLLAAWGLWVGWKHRAQRQSGLPELPDRTRVVGDPLTAPLTGLYVSTTTAGNWQDRIVARGLGIRAAATVLLTGDGVLVDRVGAGPIVVPAQDLVQITTAPGIAGKVMGRPDGILVIRWRLGDTVLDSGIRADDPDAQAEFLDAAGVLLGKRKGAAT